jgi:flavin reductase (DIM6/NTAB) family NADH-FMN oxidoreductase RutF|tara:strand:- start:386 stop:997 length:612 start_codon:yes stop_codon:yes gene_type:complete
LKINPKTFESFNQVLTGVVVPRPIAFVSTISDLGNVNLSPYSFFNAVSYDPPLIIFSSSKFTSDGKLKDSLSNIEQNGEFVVNIVNENIVEAMNTTAAEYPEDVNEFDIANLTQIDSDLVKPPRLSESPVNMECKLERIITLGTETHPQGLVIGEIIQLHIDDEIISGHRINHEKLKPVGRLAGNMYTHTYDVFELMRPSYEG